MNWVCMESSKVAKSGRWDPKRQVAMDAKQHMSITISSVACQRSSAALMSVPVSSASRGCSDVHWITRNSDTT